MCLYNKTIQTGTRLIWHSVSPMAEILSWFETPAWLIESQAVFILTCRLLRKRPMGYLVLAFCKPKVPFIPFE